MGARVIVLAGGEPIVDWDDPGSWNAEHAVAAVEEPRRSGCTDAPLYDIAANGTHGHRVLELGGSAYFVAEGIFAPGDRHRVPEAWPPRRCALCDPASGRDVPPTHDLVASGSERPSKGPLAQASGANRSTGLPSGSCTMA